MAKSTVAMCANHSAKFAGSMTVINFKWGNVATDPATEVLFFQVSVYLIQGNSISAFKVRIFVLQSELKIAFVRTRFAIHMSAVFMFNCFMKGSKRFRASTFTTTLYAFHSIPNSGKSFGISY